MALGYIKLIKKYARFRIPTSNKPLPGCWTFSWPTLKRKVIPRLFLTNIPCDCQDSELRGWIEAQGFNVDSIRIVRDQEE